MDEQNGAQQLKKRHVQGSASSPDPQTGAAATTTASYDMPSPASQPQYQIGSLQQQGARSKSQETSSLGSHHVLVPPDFAWRVLLVLPLVLWLVLTLLGIKHFQDVPRKRWEVQHWMQWFDSIFRVVGPLLPLLPWLLRWAAVDCPEWHQTYHKLVERSGGATNGGSGASDAGYGRNGGGGTNVRSGQAVCGFGPAKRARATLPWACLAAYCGIAAVRVVLYFVHTAMQQRQFAAHSHTLGQTPASLAPGFDNFTLADNASELLNVSAVPLVPARLLGGWLSDHIFLAASVLACLQVELLCSVSDCVKLDEEGAGMLRTFLVRLALLGSITLIALVCFDMYFTSRYYHFPAESAMGVLLGLLLFQGPALAWLTRQRRKA